jgi:hypothetical protein
MTNSTATLVWGRSQTLLGQRAASKELSGRILQSAFREDLSDFIEDNSFELRSPMTQENLTFEERHERTKNAAKGSIEYFINKVPEEAHLSTIMPNQRDMDSTFDPSELDFDSFIIRGVGHYSKSQPCQDALSVCKAPGVLILSNSDGVSQAPFSHFGARRMLEIMNSLLPGLVQRHCQMGSLLTAEFLTEVSMALYETVHIICSECHLHPMDAWQLLLPATFKTVIITSLDTIVIGSDDGVIDWMGSLIPVEDRIERLYTGSRNIPVLPGRCYAFDHLSERQNQKMSDEDSALYEESLSLKVIAYGKTSEVLQHNLGIYSDGLLYAREMATKSYHAHFGTIESLGLHSIITGRDTNSQSTVEYALLYHLLTSEHLHKAQVSNPSLEIIRDLCTLPTTPSALAILIENKVRSVLASYKSPLLPSHELREAISTSQLLDALLSNQHTSPDLVRPLVGKLKKELTILANDQLLKFVDLTKPALCLPLADDFSYLGVRRNS